MTVEQKPLPTELIDALLADYKKPEDLIGQNGILKQLTKAMVTRGFETRLQILPSKSYGTSRWFPSRPRFYMAPASADILERAGWPSG